MPSFVGWVPTITGRLSFSRIGDGHKGDRSICNHTSTVDRRGFLFGSETRVSRDGPLPAFVMQWFGRRPAVHFITVLEVARAQFPCHSSEPITGDPEKAPVVLQDDAEGALIGTVTFFSTGLSLPPKAREVLDDFHQLAREGRSPRCSPAERAKKFQTGKQASDKLWDDLTRAFFAPELTPGFGRVRIELRRTGECRLSVDENDLFTTAGAKRAQRSGNVSAEEHKPPLAIAAASAARQTFFFMRDLAHHHYHHDAHSDLLTTTYGWAPDQDEIWRRETQYGLVRMAIAARRQDTAKKFKQALGVIAYAEAFQKHLCGWVDNPTGIRRSRWGFAYDFAALRQSIDASLKVRELKDAQQRQTCVFVFGFVVTCLGLVLSGLHSQTPAPQSATLFINLVNSITAHPLRSLAGSAVAAWAFDLAFIHLSLSPPFLHGWIGGLSRFTEAVMGSAMSWLKKARLAYALGVAVILLTIALAAIGSCLAYYWAYRSIGH